MDSRSKPNRAPGLPSHPELTASLVSVAGGAVMGAGLGIFAAAGPPGMLVGALLGAVGGAAVATYLHYRSRHESHSDEATA